MSELRAVDIGYGFTKGAGASGEVAFPSAVGDYRPIRFTTGMEQAALKERLAVEYQGKRFFIGPIAYLQSSPRVTLSADRFTSTEGLALLLSALALLASSQHEQLNLIGGLPVAEYSRLQDKYSEALKGEHELRIIAPDGSCSGPYLFQIDKVKVLPQPVGTLFNMVLNENGGLGNKELAAGRLAVLDIGKFTVDLTLLDSLNFVDKASTSFNDIGLFTAYRNITDELKQQQGLDLPPDELEPYMTDLKRLQGLAPIKEQAFASLAERICSRVVSTWGDIWSFDRVYISGGGALALGEYIKQGLQLERAEVCHEPALANCRGYYKFGRRLWG